MKKPKIISLLNLKGGVGKTTLCINLASMFKIKKIKPLVIDLDPQKSATMWAQQKGSDFPIDVLPLSLESGPTRFKKELDGYILEYNPSVVLLDNPPELDSTSQCSCLLSDLVLIPVSPSPLDLWAAEKAIQVIKEARLERKKGLPKALFLPSKLQVGTVIGKDLLKTLKEFKEKITPPVYQRVSMVESALAGTTIDTYAPHGPSHKEFANLFNFVYKQI